MMYVEQRVIIPEHLRCFCNEHELFTKGSREDFDKLVGEITDDIGNPANVDSEAIASLALAILEKSTAQPYRATDLMNALVRLCYTTFVAV